MKQKLMGILPALALTALGLGQALGLFLSPLPEISPAAEEPTVVFTGTVIRQEQTVYAPRADFWVPVADSQRVTGGQTLMITRETRDALEMQSLEARREELASTALPLRREMLHGAIGDLLGGENSGRELMALVLSEGETALPETGALNVEAVKAPAGGFFVSVTDGLEEVLSPERPVVSLPLAPVEETAVGRLITGESWYLYGETDLTLWPGQTLPVELLSGVFRQVELTVVEAGEGKALLFCEKGAELLGNLRFLTVKILW